MATYGKCTFCKQKYYTAADNEDMGWCEKCGREVEVISREEYECPFPYRIKKAFDRYVDMGIKPGDFATAVLENNLNRAVAYADEECMDHLREIVKYMYNEMPSGCWGSKEIVQKWIDA